MRRWNPLQQTIYQGEGNTILLIDKLEEKVNQSEQVLNRLFLEEILGNWKVKNGN